MDETTYASPFSWRYGRPEMRALFSERERRRLWRAVWVSLAQSQHTSGLVSAAELADIRAHDDEIDIEAAHAIEREIGHDLMAEIRVFASQATVGGGKIHLGATSMDIEDTVEIYRLRHALSMIGEERARIVRLRSQRRSKSTPISSAWPTPTCSLRSRRPSAIVFRSTRKISRSTTHSYVVAYNALAAKGLRGAVGTSASYERLLKGSGRRARDQEAGRTRQISI